VLVIVNDEIMKGFRSRFLGDRGVRNTAMEATRPWLGQRQTSPA
jgi:hypothetical protein